MRAREGQAVRRARLEVEGDGSYMHCDRAGVTYGAAAPSDISHPTLVVEQAAWPLSVTLSIRGFARNLFMTNPPA